MSRRALPNFRSHIAFSALFCAIYLTAALPVAAIGDDPSQPSQINRSETESGIFTFLKSLLFGVMQTPNQSTVEQYSANLNSETVTGDPAGFLNMQGTIPATEENSLPGIFHIELRSDRFNGAITGGSWTRAVQETDAAGTTAIVGTLHGEIANAGAITYENEQTAILRNVQLTLKGGTGRFNNIQQGYGTLSGAIRTTTDQTTFAQSPVAPEARSFSGAMILSF